MTDLYVAGGGIVLAMILLAMRVPIGVALGLVSFGGIALLRSPKAALEAFGTLPFDFAASWSLSAVPMFVLMGAVTYHSGLTSKLYDAARVWLYRVPGGLAVASNFASAGFAAASGSSLATSAAMSKVAVPEMLKFGYDRGLATATVAASGTLGALIPPSIAFVIYGWYTEQSVPKLLIAGILPGLLTAVAYSAMIILRCTLKPRLAPRITLEVSRRERWRKLNSVWPTLFLIGGVIGGMYGGLTTASEAGAFGAFLAFVIAGVQGRLSKKVIFNSIAEAVATTASILFIAIGAVMLTRFLALAGVPIFMSELVSSWNTSVISIIILLSVVYLILGMFLDPMGLMLITLPIFLPTFKALGIDLIWMGVIIVKYIEIGLLTPPVGLNAYVVKSVIGDAVGLGTIFRGLLWFLACEAVVMVLLIGFPSISLFLPGFM
ncbi:TRAP transporter large permease subunit [uncultured Roseibium sp.]|uniref:TRAP transporter large permease n=1 Tax=uncultured Roseibium sp. TaxID=1936171 RepID=UPI00321711DF